MQWFILDQFEHTSGVSCRKLHPIVITEIPNEKLQQQKSYVIKSIEIVQIVCNFDLKQKLTILRKFDSIFTLQRIRNYYGNLISRNHKFTVPFEPIHLKWVGFYHQMLMLSKFCSYSNIPIVSFSPVVCDLVVCVYVCIFIALT